MEKCRVRLVTWVIGRLDSDDGLTIDKVKPGADRPSPGQKMYGMIPSTNINCWDKIGIQPAIVLEIVVEENVVPELQVSSLLLHFAASTDIEP